MGENLEAEMAEGLRAFLRMATAPDRCLCGIWNGVCPWCTARHLLARYDAARAGRS